MNNEENGGENGEDVHGFGERRDVQKNHKGRRRSQKTKLPNP